MTRLIPKGFLTLRQAADKIAVAMYSGVPDRPVVKQNKESGFAVDDGAAIDDAISNIWAAVDNGKLQAFVIGPKRPTPLKLSGKHVKRNSPFSATLEAVISISCGQETQITVS